MGVDTTVEQLKTRMQVGDYGYVAKVMGITRDAAKMRILRRKPETVRVLKIVLDHRDELAEKYQNGQL